MYIKNIKTWEDEIHGISTRFEYKNLTIELYKGQRSEELNYEPYFLIRAWDTEEARLEEKDLRETWDEKNPTIRWRPKIDAIELSDKIKDPHIDPSKCPMGLYKD